MLTQSGEQALARRLVTEFGATEETARHAILESWMSLAFGDVELDVPNLVIERLGDGLAVHENGDLIATLGFEPGALPRPALAPFEPREAFLRAVMAMDDYDLGMVSTPAFDTWFGIGGADRTTLIRVSPYEATLTETGLGTYRVEALVTVSTAGDDARRTVRTATVAVTGEHMGDRTIGFADVSLIEARTPLAA